MKHTATCLLLLSIFLNCNRRFEAEYNINCSFAQLDFGRKATLIVVDYAGEVLKTFEISNGSAFSGKAITRDGDSPDYYDLHLVVRDSISDNTFVYSVLGVKNGVSAHLGQSPGQNFGPNIHRTFIISGIEVLNDLTFSDGVFQALVYPSKKMVRCAISASLDQSVIVRMRANNESAFKKLFVSDSLIGSTSDTLFFSWDEFKPEGEFHSIKMEGQKPDYFYAVGVDQSFKRWAIFDSHSSNNNPGGFNIPVGVPAYLNLLDVYAQRGNAIQERIFRLGDPVEFGPPGMAISSWDMNDDNMRIRTTGEVDLIQLTVFSQDLNNPSNFGPLLYWQISGNPGDFAERKRPDIKQWLPDWVDLSKAFERGSISAYRFDLYDDLDVKAGFPFRSNERFVYARSGMTNVLVNY